MHRDQKEATDLAALASYAMLDARGESAFVKVAETSAALRAVPIAVVGIVDERRPWPMAAHGCRRGAVPREHLLCTQAIACEQAPVVTDATLDPRFADIAAVADEAHFRFTRYNR